MRKVRSLKSNIVVNSHNLSNLIIDQIQVYASTQEKNQYCVYIYTQTNWIVTEQIDLQVKQISTYI